MIVVGSLVLAFGLLGIVGRAADVASQHRSSDRSVHVGQCVNESDFRDNNLNPAPQNCAKQDALFEVVTRGDGSTTCPDGKLQDSTYAFLRKDATTLCFMLNFQQGQCYAPTGTADNPTFCPTDCDGSQPRFKVDKRIDDSSNAELCGAGTRAISYPSPARLYCLQPLEN